MTREELFRSEFTGAVLPPDISVEMTLAGAVVSHVGIYWDRVLVVDGHEVQVAGIGGVVTHPSWRGKGFASALLDFAHEWIKDRGVDLAALFCDEATYRRLYERHGYIHEWRSDWPPNLAICPLLGTAFGGTDFLGAIEEPAQRW